MTEYVVVAVTRKVDPKTHRGSTIEHLPAFPEPTEGAASFLTGRTISLPGFAPGNVWDSDIDRAARYPTKAAATRAARQSRRGFVATVAEATEWKRRRHVARARAKARKL
jgi:hypothetical protein